MGRQFSVNSAEQQASRERVQNYVERHDKKRKMLEFGIGLILLIAGLAWLIINIVGIFEVDEYAEMISENVVLKQQEYDQLKSSDGAKDDGKYVTLDAIAYSAADTGLTVCNLQNKLAQYTRQARASGDLTMTKEHRDTLAEYRKYCQDYNSGIDNAVKGTWCEYGTWYFDSTFDYEGTVIPVVWRCFDKDELLAVCTAKYNADSNAFSELSLYKTISYQDVIITAAAVTTTATERTTRDIPTTDPEITTTNNTTFESDTTTIPSDTFIESSYTSEGEYTMPSITTTYIETAPPVTIVTAEYVYEYPEEQWFYGWSEMYQCWGYFNQNGKFLTEEEYQNEMGAW